MFLRLVFFVHRRLVVTVTLIMGGALGAMVGCQGASDHQIDKVFDPCEHTCLQVQQSVSNDVLASIDAGARMWRALSQARVDRECQAESAILPISFEKAAPMFHGIYRDEVGDVVINTHVSDPVQLSVVVAHELGHAFGLHHVPKEVRSSVMNPGNLARLPDARDGDLLAEIWGRCAAE